MKTVATMFATLLSLLIATLPGARCLRPHSVGVSNIITGVFPAPFPFPRTFR